MLICFGAIAASPAFAIPVLEVQSPSVSETPNEQKSSLMFIVAGQISGDRLWVNGQWIALPLKGENPPIGGSDGIAAPTNPGNSSSPRSDNSSGKMPARFAVAVSGDGRCADSVRIRDLLYLLRSLAKAIGAVEVSYDDAGKNCAESLQRQFLSYGIAASITPQGYGGQESPSSRQQVSIRVHFAGDGKVIEPETGGRSSPEFVTNPESNEKKTHVGQKLVFLNSRKVATSVEGWFVAQVSDGASVDIEIRSGSDVIHRSQAEVMIIKPGFNSGYKTDRYVGVTLEHGSSLQAKIAERTEKSFAGFGIEVSVPVFLKIGLGYTALNPLPTENERDRATVVFAARSYPFWERYHVSGEVMTSIKSGSRIPWTVLATVLGGTDLIQFRGNWSVPVGAGFRMFQSSIKKEKGEAANGKPIRIPEAVLGPALQAGASYRSGLFYAEVAGSVTPVFASGAKPIVTFNPLFSSGYQISAIDIVTLNIMNQDIRYPSLLGEAKVVSSSIVIGYQRDLL